MNVEADWQSRISKDHSESKILSQVFQRIFQIKGKPEMDFLLFDCYHNFHGTLYENQNYTVRQ